MFLKGSNCPWARGAEVLCGGSAGCPRERENLWTRGREAVERLLQPGAGLHWFSSRVGGGAAAPYGARGQRVTGRGGAGAGGDSAKRQQQ